MSSKRRVALITNLCPHYRRPLFELLAQRFDLDCFFSAETEPYANPLVPAFDLGDFRRVQLRRMSVFGESVLPGLARAVTRARYDAVVVSLTGRLMVPYAFGIARARRVPFVLWTGMWHHPRTPFHRATRGLVESVYRRSDAIVVYGDHVRRALLAVGGVDNDKIFTAAQSVDGRAFAIDVDVAKSNQLLFVGHFESHKGIDDLLSAFARVSDPNARLSVIGNGSLEANVRRQARIDPRIDIAGYVPQGDLPRHFARARGLVLPSVTTSMHRECWGLVVNEAMHAGIPVIATDAVGAAAHGLVEDGSTGLVVKERDPVALGTAMTRLFSDDVLAADLGRRARERVSGFTFDAMADAFEAAVEFGIRRREGRDSRIPRSHRVPAS